jgi:hypothetical protein
MFHFRDQTFCKSDCTHAACPRHFGEDDESAAREWARRIGFDEGAPIAWSDFSEGCKDYTKPEPENR